MLDAKKIVKTFGETKVLKGVDLFIPKNEVVSIVGASGAGKSTLLHIIGTLDSPTSGEVVINGENVSTMSSKKLAKFRNEQIGFVFQFHNLLPEFTATENITIPAYLGKRQKKVVEEKADYLLNLLGVYHRKNNLPSQLSGGEQQRVSVARALINSPSIIFADEPSGNLDSKNADELHQLFFRLRDELNQTFVIVTHNPQLAEMTDRMIELKAGEII